jgi:hypothetical protein
VQALRLEKLGRDMEKFGWKTEPAPSFSLGHRCRQAPRLEVDQGKHDFCSSDSTEARGFSTTGE